MSITSPTAHGSWHGRAELHFGPSGASDLAPTRHRGRTTAPLKLMRGTCHPDGRCELPLLHTAGGLVGGDRLSVSARLEARSRALITSVAAQKVYGSIGRCRLAPEGRWALQQLDLQLAEGADLEWLPQELVLYADALYQQDSRIQLAPGASYLGAEVVRLGRTAAGETLASGCWRSSLQIERLPEVGEPRDPLSRPAAPHLELVDRLALEGEALTGEHGMAGEPVFGSLVWAAPQPLPPAVLTALLEHCRSDRQGLAGTMACGALRQGLVARYRGPSSQAARFWFSRLWARIRSVRGLPPPDVPRVWPFQETPWR